MNNNPFCIPDLNPMYNKVKDFVKEHQGEKGFILTDNSECDTIWTIVYDGYYGEVREFEVKAVRVVGDRLECYYDLPGVTYKEKDIEYIETRDWHSVVTDDEVMYIPTIFSIAESISEYVEQ